MNNRVELTTPCKLIGEDHFRGWITPRKASDLRALIAKHLQEHPAEPLRLDVHETEWDALQAATVGLRCCRAYNKHADGLRDEAGFGRFIFWGPGWTLPKDRREQFRAYYTADEIADIASRTCYDYGFMLPQLEAAQGKADELTRGHLQLASALLSWVRWTLKDMSTLRNLSADDARLFALLITHDGQTADGRAKYLPIREIAKRLEVSPAMVEKRIKNLRRVKSLAAWLDRNAPRKARGSRWGRCTKPKQV